jgi:hypothetical protein
MNKATFMIDNRTEDEYLKNVDAHQRKLREVICPRWSRIDGKEWVVISEETHIDLESVVDKGDLECPTTQELLEVKEVGHFPIIVLKSYQLRNHKNELIDYLIIRNSNEYCRVRVRDIIEKGDYLPTKLRIWNGKGDFGILVEKLEWRDFI